MSSGFISESEILEARRRRQDEWEKVRTEDQPKEAPEEPYDNRPLYQRLEEQRVKKEAEYEEAHKLKNMIRGLDDDEVGFLDLVERTKAKAAQQISIEEQREMQEFRERVSTLAESEEMTRLRAQLAPARTTNTSSQAITQKTKLQGMVVRKRKASDMEVDKQKKPEKDTPPAKAKASDMEVDKQKKPEKDSPPAKAKASDREVDKQKKPEKDTPPAKAKVSDMEVDKQKKPEKDTPPAKAKASDMEVDNQKKPQKDAPPAKANGVVSTSLTPQNTAEQANGTAINGGTLRCIGVLPGLGHYDTDSTSDTDDSSDMDSTDKCCKRDMLGRRPEVEKSRKEGEKS